MVRPRTLLVVVVVLAVAATCVGLGFWQIGRAHEKAAANDLLRRVLAEPPRPLTAGVAGTRYPIGRVRVEGRYDEGHQVVLVGRALDGQPGVHVVTPLLPDDGGPAILVDRGFVPAPDAMTAWPPAYRESTSHTVVGLIEPVGGRAGDPLWQRSPNDSIHLWTTRWIDPDSVAAAFPYVVAPALLRELPGPGVPDEPRRVPVRFADTTIHWSYAGQWFFFALITLVGPLVVARVRRRRRLDASGGPS